MELTPQDPTQDPTKPKRRFGPGQAAALAADRQDPFEQRKQQFEKRSSSTWRDNILPTMGLGETVSAWTSNAIKVAESGSGRLGEFMSEAVPEEHRQSVAMSLKSYSDWMKQREVTPLAQTTRSRKDLERLRDIMVQPGGIETLETIAGMTGDQTVLDSISQIKSSVSQAHAARILGAGPAVSGGKDDYLHGKADLAVALGIRKGFDAATTTTKKVKYGADVWYQDSTVPMSEGRLPIYLEAIDKFRLVAQEKAQEYGLEVEGLGEKPVTSKEAKAVLDASIKVLEQTQPKDMEDEGVEIELASQEQITKAAANYLKVVSKYAEMNPDEETTLAESMATVTRFMQGEEVREDEIGGVTSLLVGTLNLIAAPDRAINALTVGAQPKIRPIALVFEDGFQATDTLAAAEHAMLLQAQGYEPGQSPSSVNVSEASRAGALLESTGEAVGEFFEPTWKNLIPGYAVGNALDVYSRAAQTGVAGVGQAVDLALPNLGGQDEAGVGYAYPVAIYGAVTEEVQWGDRWGDAVRAFSNAEGEFMFDSMYDQAMSGTASASMARKWTVGINSLAWEFAVSPWNLAGTGMVAAEGAEAAGRAIGKEAAKTSKRVAEIMETLPPPSVKSGTIIKPKRQVRFDDGAEMNANWVGAHDNLARLFGRGKGHDFNAADEMASMILTAARDNPAKTTEELMGLLKQDEKFLRQLTNYMPDLAMPGVFKRAGMSEDQMVRQTQRLWESVEGDVSAVIDAASTRMGPKFADAADRTKMMEQARGLFVGGFGVSTSRGARLLERTNEKIAGVAAREVGEDLFGTAKAKALMDKQMSKIYTQTRERLESGLIRLQSGFSADAYSTGLAAHGGRGYLPEVKAVPFRMKKLFQEQYRRRMAAAEAQAQAAVNNVFSYADSGGKTQILRPRDRVLVTLLADGEEDFAKSMRNLFERRELLKNTGVKIPSSPEAWLARSKRLEPYVQKLREHWDAFGESMVERGLVTPDKLLDGYMPRIYKGIDNAKLNEYLSKKAEKVVAETAVPGADPTTLRKGTHARVRHGPVDLLEAIEKGFDPELDAAALLYTRAVQFGEVEAKAIFAERIGAAFGEPVITRKETLARMLHDSNTSAWDAAKRVVDAKEESRAYYRSLGKVTSAIRDSNYRGRRRGFRSLAEKMGVGMRDLRSPETMLPALVESEDFLKLASSKRKSFLDEVLPGENLREALRSDARSLRAAMLREQRAQKEYISARASLGERTVRESGDGGALERLAKEYKENGPRLTELRERQRTAKVAVKSVRAELSEAKWNFSQVKKDQEAIGKRLSASGRKWDKAKEAIAAEGGNPNAVGFPERNYAPAGVSETAFREYKDRQREYVALAKQSRETDSALRYAEDIAKQSEKRLERALHADGMASGDLKKKVAEMRQTSKAITAEKSAIKGRASRVDAAAEKFVEASEALSHAKNSTLFVMSSPAMRETAGHISREAANLTAAHKLIRDRISAHGSRYNLTSNTVRHRALSPRKVAGVEKAAGRAEEARASLGRRKTTQRQEHVPYVPQGESRGYVEIEDQFAAFGWSERDVGAFLWDTFGAHHMTEVPLAELKALTGSHGGMMAKVGRFLYNPVDYEGRKVALKLLGGDDLKDAREIARVMGVNTRDFNADQWGAKLLDRLDAAFAKASKGDPAAEKLVDQLDPTKLSKLYVAQDVGEAGVAIAKGQTDKASGELAARMVSNADSPLAKKLGNTYIPLEIGLMHKQMIGEGIADANKVLGYAQTTKWLKGLANKLGTLDSFNSMFKAGATVGRGSFAFGRRNAWFDGAKNLLHLGLYGGMNPEVRAEFFRDMLRREGVMETPNGPLSMKAFHNQLDKQGFSMFSQRLDQAGGFDTVNEIAGRGGKSAGSKKRTRFNRETEQAAKLARPGKGLNFEKEQKVGAGIGAALGTAVGDPLLGAGMGYTAGTLTHGFRDVVSHTGGSMPRKVDFLVPLGAAANERMENFYRAFAYWSHIKAGMGPQEAVERMLGMMRDYSNLTPLGQDILRRVPVLFYNFGHQNVIAMGKRMAQSPARTTFGPRLVMALSGREEGTEDYQTVASTLTDGGFGYTMSDEFEAAISIFEPIWQLAHGEGAAAWEAMKGTMSPIVGESIRFAEQKGWERAMPQAIARRLYNQLGSFDVPGFSVSVNENGAVSGKMNAVGAYLLDITALYITANDVGRAQSWVDRGEISKSVLEYVFGVRVSDLDSFFDGRRELLNAEMQRVFDGLDGLQWDEEARNLVFENPNMFDAEHRHIMEEFTKAANGKHMLQGIKDFQKIIRDYQGQSRDYAPQQPTGNTTLEIKR